MKRYCQACFLSCVFFTFAAPPAEARQDELGRLFFTPQERLRLDRQRLYGEDKETAEKKKEAEAPVPELIAVDGLILRSDGKNTVWLNGSRQLQQPGVRVESDKLHGLAVPIRLINGDRQFYLKPGQRIDTGSNLIIEKYQVKEKPSPAYAKVPQ